MSTPGWSPPPATAGRNSRPTAAGGSGRCSVALRLGPLLAEAVVRIPFVYLLAIGVGVAVTEARFIATTLVLARWSVRYLWHRREYFTARSGMAGLTVARVGRAILVVQ